MPLHISEFDFTYLPATAPAERDHIDVMGIAERDGTDLFHAVDYHHPGAGVLRLTREQARHLYIALGHTLKMTES